MLKYLSFQKFSNFTAQHREFVDDLKIFQNTNLKFSYFFILAKIFFIDIKKKFAKSYTNKSTITDLCLKNHKHSLISINQILWFFQSSKN